ncbi:TRAP transporter small permease [Marinimicrococcus flavescens]|uniref:TRAP transporter small permease protein n=1 Tax=Marinimicrococcus flavescens TaxID=3031815 RepID=A0AAP3XSA1_9PROT|nr:TRAP transporter small permease [Marinimicrococcus flavescens]
MTPVQMFRRVLEHSLVGFCIFLIVALTVLISAAAITRKFGVPFGWYDEVASVMLAWLTYYGAAYAALRRSHIGVPSIVGLMPPGVRVALVLFGQALVLGFFGLVAWFGWQVLVILEGDTMITLPWVPVRLTQSVIPIGAVLFIVADLLTLPERLAEAAQGAPARDGELAEVLR